MTIMLTDDDAMRAVRALAATGLLVVPPGTAPTMARLVRDAIGAVIVQDQIDGEASVSALLPVAALG